MNILSMDGVSKFTDKGPLFERVTLGVDEGERIGFVGPNGSGKSTFMKIVSGEMVADSGTISRARNLSVSVLEQNPAIRKGMTLRDFLLDGNIPAARLAREYERCLHEVSGGESRDHELSDLTHRMESEGGFAFMHTFESLCVELGLPDQDAVMEAMSGGMVKKAAVARVLSSGSRLLLLDEPTNHLDIETIEWFESKLLSGGFAFLLVTHDRRFLDAVCQKIMEIDRGAIFKYEGNYSTFVERRRERWLELEKADSRREAILKIELAWLARGARARATKSERRKEMIRGMQAAGLERPDKIAAFSQEERKLGRKILVLEGVCKSFGSQPVIRDFTWQFSKGGRIGLVGPNGSGKTTILEMITGGLKPDSGTMEKGENTVFGYFDQRLMALSRDISALEYVREAADIIRTADGTQLQAEQFLERFLFDRVAMQRALPTFSGGELKRLALVRLLASAPNFLLFDEPTNDFDIDTIELLEDYLSGFGGCVLIVSHDRAFLDAVTDTTIVLAKDGTWSVYPDSYGGYRDYLAENPVIAPAAKERPVKEAQENPEGVSPRRKPTWKEKQEYEAIMPCIEELEAEKAGLEASFSSGSRSPVELARDTARYHETEKLIQEKIARWEELSAIVEG